MVFNGMRSGHTHTHIADLVQFGRTMNAGMKFSIMMISTINQKFSSSFRGGHIGCLFGSNEARIR